MMLAVLTTAEIGEWDGFLNGGIANRPAMEAAGANEPAPFNFIQGDDASSDAEFEFSLTTTSFGQDLGEFAFTIGLADHDTARAGIQLALFTIDGADFTGVMNQAFESYGGEQAVYNIYTVLLPPAAGARVADGNAVFRFEFAGGGLSGLPRDTTTPAGNNGMNIDFARVAPRCAINLLPYRLEGDFTRNAALDRCEATGPVTIHNGTAPPIHVSGGIVWVADERLEATGTFSMMVDGVMKDVFIGTAGETLESTPNYNTWMTFTQPVEVLLPPENRPAGLPVKLNDLHFDPGKLRSEGGLSVPEIGGLQLPSTQFVLGATGLTLGGLGTQVPDIDATLFGVLQIKTHGLYAGYTPQSNQLKLEGQFTIKSLIGGSGPSLTARFAPGTGIVVDADGVDFSGSISVSDLTVVPGVFTLKELTVSAEVQNSTLISIGGAAKVRLAGGVEVAGAFNIINGELDTISLSGSGLKFPIGSTGLFLQRVGGSVSGLATGGPDPTFAGSVGFSFGPEYDIHLPEAFGGDFEDVSLLSIDLSASATIDFFDFENSDVILRASVMVQLLGGIATGTGSIAIDFRRVELEIDTTFSALAGFIRSQSHLSANASLNLSANGSASITIPESVPLVGGTELFGGRMFFNYSHNGTLSDDYIAGYADITTWFGTFRTGARVNFDGTASILGLVPLNEAPAPAPPLDVAGGPPPGASRAFIVPPGSRFAVLSAAWANADDDVPLRVIAPDGTNYTPANFGMTVNYLDEFTSSKRATVAVHQPMPGAWTLELPDTTALGAVTFEGFDGLDEPTLVVTSPAQAIPGGIAQITYQATAPSDGATVTLFYDTDGIGFDGRPFALARASGSTTYGWDTSGLAPGAYHVYAVVNDPRSAPIFEYAPGTVRVGDETPRPVADEFRVDSAFDGISRHDVAADAAGNFVVVWTGYRYNPEPQTDVWARLFRADGTPLGDEFKVNDHRLAGSNTAVAMDSAGGFVVTWEVFTETGGIILARRFNAAGQPLDIEPFQVSDSSPGEQPAIEMNAAGEFAIAWVSELADDQGNRLGAPVLLRRYSTGGVPLGDAVTVTTAVFGAQGGVTFNPSIAAANDSWVVAWGTSDYDSGVTSVFARVYETHLTPRTTEQPIAASYYISADELPVVDADDDGQFVVIWATDGSDDGPVVYARRFDADATGLGATIPLWNSRNPSLLVRPDGDFLIAWEIYGSVGAWQYDRDGNPVTTLVLNVEQQYAGAKPLLAPGADSGFVAAWRGIDSPDIYARVFEAPAALTTPRIVSGTIQTGSELHFKFNKDVRGSVDLSDVVVTNLDTGQTIGDSSFALELFGDTVEPTTAIWRSLVALPAGNYRATLPGGAIADAYGRVIADAFSFDFSVLAGDFDNSSVVDHDDIDLLFVEIGLANHPAAFDLTGDSFVDAADATYLVETILTTTFGDANLDRRVDRLDAAIVALNFGRSGGPAWARGDFNGDGDTDLADLAIGQRSFAFVGPVPAPAAPSPSAARAALGFHRRAARIRSMRSSMVDQAITSALADSGEVTPTPDRSPAPLRAGRNRR
jgi:hypothetical protein